MRRLAAWMTLAYRSGLPTAEQWRIAQEGGPDPRSYPVAVVEREHGDLLAVAELDGRPILLTDPDYPRSLVAGEDAPLMLWIAGRADLLEEDGVVHAAYRTRTAPGIGERIEAGDRVVAVLSKGLLKARTLLRALHDPIADGQIALLSAEPPRASWSRLRDERRDRLVARLSEPLD